MLKFFALYKRKITGISNTAFYHQIGIISKITALKDGTKPVANKKPRSVFV